MFKNIKLNKKDYLETITIAIPVIIGQLSSMLMHITDNMVVGHLGKESLSAATLANSCYILIAIFSFGCMNPIPAVVAETRGAGNEKDLNQHFHSGAYAGIFHGFLGCLLVFLFSLFMPFLGQPESDTVRAIPFLNILAFSTIPACIFLGIKGFYDGLENTLVGMTISIIGLVLNLFFNIGLVFGKFGMPEFGMIGSAYATLISRTLMLVVMLLFVFLDKKGKKYTNINQFEWKYLTKLLILGFPMGLQIFFEVAAFAGAVIVIGWLPDVEVNRSAHQIAMNMASMTFMFMVGLSVAGSVRVGEAFGRKDRNGIIQAGNASLVLGIGITVLFAMLLVLFRARFSHWYGIDEEAVRNVTIRLVIVAAVFQLFDGAQCVAGGLLRGVQDVFVPAVITFVAYIVIWTPLAYWLAFDKGYGVDGIWYAFVIALGFAAFTLNWRFYVLSRKKDLAA
jgi:multidrug resistance protein, MATE family